MEVKQASMESQMLAYCVWGFVVVVVLSPFGLSFHGMVKGLWLVGTWVLLGQRGDDLE